METWRKKLSFPLAILFAALASVSAHQYLKDRGSVSIAKVEPTFPVVVAGREVSAGAKLTLDDLNLQQWPKGSGSEDYFSNPKDLIGRMLRSSLITDEPLTSGKLMRDEENFSALIQPHMRGITVTIRHSNTLEKLLQRGSLVDVIALFEGNTAPTTKVIAQAVRVLAVQNPDAIALSGGPRQMEVTLMVRPRDAEWIVKAMNQGVIELAIRNERDSSLAEKPVLL